MQLQPQLFPFPIMFIFNFFIFIPFIQFLFIKSLLTIKFNRLLKASNLRHKMSCYNILINPINYNTNQNYIFNLINSNLILLMIIQIYYFFKYYFLFFLQNKFVFQKCLLYNKVSLTKLGI